VGVLTNDMNRLRGEIRGLRAARKALTKDRRGVVVAMQAGFRNAHAEMARRTKADLSAFVSGLRRTVSALRREVADDILGARRAWFGKH
jgi:hypothetical protein